MVIGYSDAASFISFMQEWGGDSHIFTKPAKDEKQEEDFEPPDEEVQLPSEVPILTNPDAV